MAFKLQDQFFFWRCVVQKGSATRGRGAARPILLAVGFICVSQTVVLNAQPAQTELEQNSAPTDPLRTRVSANEQRLELLQFRVEDTENLVSNILTTLGTFKTIRRNFDASSEAGRPDARGAESVAIGGGSIATDAYTVSIGAPATEDGAKMPLTRRLTYLAAGIAESDAVNVAQLKSVDDRLDRVAARTSDVRRDVDATSEQMRVVQAQVGGLETLTDNLAFGPSGARASASGPNSSAIGPGARASAGNATAVGSQSRALFSNSTALGSGAQVQRPNQIMIGTRTNTYTMPGLVSPGSQAAQSGPVGLVTVDADGNLASDHGQTVAGLETEIEVNASQILAQQTVIAGHQDAIAQNTRSIDQQAMQIQSNQSSILANQVELRAHESEIEMNAQSIQLNSDAIASNKQTAAQISAEVDLLRAGFGGESERFNAVEDAIEDQAQKMKASETAIATHATAIDDNTEAIAENSNQISQVTLSVHANQVRIADNEVTLASHSQAITGLQTDVDKLSRTVEALASHVSQTQSDIEANRAGIAVANALAGSTWLQANESIALSLNAGYFEGETAYAMSGAARLHKRVSANFAVGGVPSRNEVGARAGLRLGW